MNISALPHSLAGGLPFRRFGPFKGKSRRRYVRARTALPGADGRKPPNRPTAGRKAQT